jgi:glycosyltransferase involved in cell wall biosynthesis
MMTLTILMPVRGVHEQFLAEAIGSVFAQTSPDWRLLAVVEPNDAAQFAGPLHDAIADARVAIMPNEGRKLAGAINTGMRRAQTPFVALLLADDMWAPEAVTVLADQIARFPGVDFFHSARRVVDDAGRSISSVYRAKETFALDDFARESPVKHLLCWRRETALACGGLDESLSSLVGVDDWDFPWTMAEHGARFKAVQECLYVYRDHREGFRLTTHVPRSTHVRELRRIMRKHGVGPVRRFRLAHRQTRSYLRQCLYRSTLDRAIKERLGFDARRGWRETYR